MLEEALAPAHLWVPEYSSTNGDFAAQVAEELGMTMDPEQRQILDAIYAEHPDCAPVCFEVGVIAPRQNIKTAVLQIAALTDLFVFREPLHIWTAHLFPTARKSFEKMIELIEGNADYRRRCRAPRTAHGHEAIELLTGETIEFHARSSGGGRGYTAPKLTLDEGLFLQPSEMGALQPTLATLPNAQMRVASSAGLQQSQVLREMRDRGRRGGSGSLAWFEYGAPPAECQLHNCQHVLGMPGCALDREDLWLAANPALGRRISVERMRSFRQSMPPAEFAREFLTWWDEPPSAAAAFGSGNWEACSGQDRPADLPLDALAVAVSFDQTWSAIGGAAVDEHGIVYGKTLQHGPGTSWLRPRLAELQGETGVEVAIDEKGPAATHIPDLERGGIALRKMSRPEVLDACALIFNLVQDKRFRHPGLLELNRAAAGAIKVPSGDRWAWGRKVSADDICPLEAVTFAVWRAVEPGEQLPPADIF